MGKPARAGALPHAASIGASIGVSIGRTPANARGPALLHLLVDSEGSCEVITQATIPQTVCERVFLFDNLTAGRAAVRARWQRGLTPARVQLSDQAATTCSFALFKAAHDQDGVV